VKQNTETKLKTMNTHFEITQTQGNTFENSFSRNAGLYAQTGSLSQAENREMNVNSSASERNERKHRFNAQRTGCQLIIRN
jgi:hypothetical protein